MGKRSQTIWQIGPHSIFQRIQTLEEFLHLEETHPQKHYEKMPKRFGQQSIHPR